MRKISRKQMLPSVAVIAMAVFAVTSMAVICCEKGENMNPMAETDPLTDIDGNGYRTVKIGAQVWMTENLRVTRFRNGDGIPHVADQAEWPDLIRGAYCHYNNDPENSSTSGCLYNWYAVDDGRGVAPAGWHVPADADWQILITCLGGDTASAGKLKEAGMSHWRAPNRGSTNESRFSAIPSGYRDFGYGDYFGIDVVAVFWSSTENDSGSAWNWNLVSREPYVYRKSSSKICIFDPVREGLRNK
jgi:uncharacterized protein (TIGR02145 family)